MSVLIKGMKLPKDTVMTINIWADGHVYILGKKPMMLLDAAVELPDHGDLIDRDVLLSKVQKWYWEALETVKRMPTVIPAERSEE